MRRELIGAAVLVAGLLWLLVSGGEEESTQPIHRGSETAGVENPPDLLEAGDGAAAPAAGETPSPPAPPQAPRPQVAAMALKTELAYRDGDRKVRVWRNPRVLLEFRMPRKGVKGPLPPAQPPVAGARLVRTNRFTHIWELPEGSDSQALAEHLQVAETGDYSPAFHTAPTSEARIQGLPGGVMVKFPRTWRQRRVEQWAAKHELTALRKMAVEPNWYAFETEPGMESLETANRLYATGEVLAASPNWWRDQKLR